MSDNGWIKAHRNWMEDPVIWKDADHIAVWMYLQLNATHKGYQGRFNGKITEIKPGQIITGRYAISDRTGVHEQKVKRILIDLQNNHLIDRQRSNKNSLISLINWDVEQNSDRQNDHVIDPSSDHETRMKECNNKKINSSSSEIDEGQLMNDFSIIYAIYPKKTGKAQAFINYKKWISKTGFKISKTYYKATNKEIYLAVKEYVTEKLETEDDPDHPNLQYWKGFDVLMNKSLLDYLERVWEREKLKGASE